MPLSSLQNISGRLPRPFANKWNADSNRPEAKGLAVTDGRARDDAVIRH